LGRNDKLSRRLSALTSILKITIFLSDDIPAPVGLHPMASHRFLT
jgi:hypothetical protein